MIRINFGEFGRLNSQMMLVRGVGMASNLGFHVALTHILGAGEYGVWAATTALLTCLLPMARCGWDTGLLRHAADAESDLNLRRLTRSALLSSTVVAAVLAVAATGYLAHFEPAVSIGWPLAFAWLAGAAAIEIIAAELCGLKHVSLAFLVRDIFRPIFAMTGFYLLIDRLGYRPDSELAFQAGAAALISLSIGLYVALHRLAPLDTVKGQKYSWRHECLPYCLTAVVCSILERIDILIFSHFAEDVAVGRYSVASRLASYVPLILITASAATAPLFVEARQSKTAVQRLFRKVTFISIIGAVPIALALAVAPNLLLGIFGRDFQGDTLTLRLLVVGQCFLVLAGPSQLFLGMCGHKRALVVLLLIATANSFVFQLIGASTGSSEWLAVAVVASSIAWHGSMWLVARRIIRQMPDDDYDVAVE